MALNESPPPPHDDDDDSMNEPSSADEWRPRKYPEAESGRGGPRGCRELRALGSLGGVVAEIAAGGSFTPYVMTVNAEEDVVSKILEFSQKVTPLAVCILSAVGSVSMAVLHKPDSSTVDPLRLEGHFELLSLSGSPTLSGDGHDAQGNKRMLSVLLADSEGRVFGGILAVSLITAEPIKLVVASFEQNVTSKRPTRSHSAEPYTGRSNRALQRFYQKVPGLIVSSIHGYTSPTTGLIPKTSTTGASHDVFPGNQDQDKQHSA